MRAPKRRWIVALVGLATIVWAAGAVAVAQRTGNEGQVMQMDSGSADIETLPNLLRALLGERHWMNTSALGAEDLRGKVIVVNFWTYSCINSLRTLPYLRAWADRYLDRGLIVIGVHTPEFGFEHDDANVRGALSTLSVGYPVVLDNDFEIWRGFGNQAWPGFYFIDARGRVRHHAFGEGDYEDAERLIQRVLAERDGGAATGATSEIRGVGDQAAPDWENLRSPETYIGYGQARNFSSDGGIRSDRSARYRAIRSPSLNHWSLAGQWTVERESARMDETTGAIIYRFHARDLHLVLAPAIEGRAIRFRVTIDDRPPGADHGVDTDADGWGAVTHARMYQLVR